MVRVFTEADAKDLGLKGRKSLEIVSGLSGESGVTVRLVEIPVPDAGEKRRGPHRHTDFEECIYILSGQGTMESDTGNHNLKTGDTIVVPPGEWHVTRNTGTEPIMMLCYFPVGDIRPNTENMSTENAPEES
jgi:quercetin dioxygenase-like cupin family protein